MKTRAKTILEQMTLEEKVEGLLAQVGAPGVGGIRRCRADVTDIAAPYDLDALEDGRVLGLLLQEVLGCRVTHFAKIGAGFYAAVYEAWLDGEPEHVVVKWFKYPGYSAREGAQLKLLSRHAILRVPEVYGIHRHTPDLPYEALVMEHIPGVNASKIQFPSDRVKARFIEQVLDNLLAWHGVESPEGYGDIGGPFYPTWLGCLSARVGTYQDRVHADRHRDTVSPYVMGVIDRSAERLPEILAGADGRASLVHSDYNLWNVLYDPRTFQVTGVIDPIDAEWNDPEIDLFHLPNCRPDVGLLERYLERVKVSEGFSLRYAFYRFWDDVKHYLRMGWYEEKRFRTYARALEEEMIAHGLA